MAVVTTLPCQSTCRGSPQLTEISFMAMGLLFFVPDGSMGVGALRAFTRSADWQNLRAPKIESTMGPTPGEARSQGIPHLQPSSPKSRDLDPALARFLKNYLGNRQGGFLFVT